MNWNGYPSPLALVLGLFIAALYVSDRATVGAITGATAIPFSGDSPPS
ncbi:MAG: hypothetical protein ABSG30_12845 [Steroidobacteraceae bacterium]